MLRFRATRGRKLISTMATLAVLAVPVLAGLGGTAGVASAQTGSSSATTATLPAVGYNTVSYSDVTPSTPHYASIVELTALGLASGTGNGAFGPSTDVTRAEFAKFIIGATGLTSAATGSGGVSQFSDVPAGQWYTGYVNVAAARGIVDGYPDGTFRPNADVTYAEAVTMVVRALGYQPNVIGPWPSGYMAEAASIPNTAPTPQDTLLSGLTLQLTQPMDRADVSRLMVNALYAALPSTTVVQQVGANQVRNTVTGPNTLLGRLGYTGFYPGSSQSAPPTAGDYSDVVTGTIANVSGLNSNQIQIGSLAPNGPPLGTSYTAASTLGLVGAADLSGLLGLQVSYVTDMNGNLVYLNPVTPASDVLPAGTNLGTQLTATSYVLTAAGAPAGSNLAQIALQPPNATAYITYNVAQCPTANGQAVCTLAVPASGTFQGSNGSNDNVAAVLNTNGNIIALIDNSATTAYKDVELASVSATQLSFYDGSQTPSSLGIAPGASVTIDGNPASVADLKAPMVLNIVVNSQSQAALIQASDKTVTGSISNVTTQTTGNIYITVNGSYYKLQTSSTVYAVAGQVLGAAADDLGGLTNNAATIGLGVDNRIGYINLTQTNTVIGMALNSTAATGSSPQTACSGQCVLDVEQGNGSVTAYPVDSNQNPVAAGDIVRLTLNVTDGMADVTDYAGGFGVATSPALVTGVLGSELQFEPLCTGASNATRSCGRAIDAYLPANTPVFDGSGGGGYNVGQLPGASDFGSIAPSAGTMAVGGLQPGYYVTIGVTGSGDVQGVLYLSNNGAGSNTLLAAGGLSSAATAYGTVDAAAVTAQTAAAGGELGTAAIVPLGATAPINVSVESASGGNTELGSGAGTNASIFQLTTIGGSLIQSNLTQAGTAVAGVCTNTLSLAVPSGTSFSCSGSASSPTVTAPTGGVAFQQLTTAGNAPALELAGGATFTYGSGTVVVNVPNNNIEPIGSLVPGQQVLLWYEPLAGSNFATFIEVVNTATSTTTATTTGTNYSVTATVNGTAIGTVSVSSVVYAVYAVTGAVTNGTAGVDGATVTVGVSLPDQASSTAGVGALLSTLTTVTTGSDGGYTGYLYVPPSQTSSETVTVSYADPAGALHTASGTVPGT